MGIGPMMVSASTSESEGGKAGRKAHIKEVMEHLAEKMGPQKDRLFLVGGSWRAIARIDMERRGYPLHVLHEYRMTAKSVQATAKHIESSDLDELRLTCCPPFPPFLVLCLCILCRTDSSFWDESTTSFRTP